MAELSGNTEVPLGRQESGLAQVLDNNRSMQYLIGARQRQDQINHYAALEKLKRDQMEAARKKAEEDNQISASWEVDNGLDFATGTKQLTDADIMATKKILADPNIPKYKKDQAVKDSAFLIQSRNTWAANQKAAFDKVESEAGYYQKDPVKRIEYVKQALQDPNYFKNNDHAIGYQKLLFDPYNFNAKAAGTDLLKGIGTTTVEVENADGSSSKTTWDNILNQPKLVGKNKVVAKINPEEAAKIISTNPQVSDWYTRFVEKKQADIVGSDPQMPPKEALEIAMKMGTDMLFDGLATINYKVDKTTIRGKAKQSSQGAEDAKTKEVVRPLDLNYVPRTAPVTQPVGVLNQGLAGIPGPKPGPKRIRFIDAIGRQFEKPVTIGPGVNAILLSGEDEKTPDFLTKQSDGTYRTKFGFKTPNMVEIPNAKYTTTIITTPNNQYEAGEILEPAEVRDIIDAGKGDMIKSGRVGRFAPTTMQIDEMDGKLTNPSLQNIDILIPMEDIPQADVFSADKGVSTKTTRFKSLKK